MTLLEQKLEQFKLDHPGYRVIYVSLIGSKLYGTDGPNSDEDFKGIYIPTTEDILLKKDQQHYTFTTGDKDSKNGSEDLDLQLWSIHKFFTLLSKGDTGAMDLLFSMTGANVPVISSRYSNTIYANREYFITKNMKAFLGYCIGQSQKYNIKGERYKELCTFIDLFKEFPNLWNLENITGYKYIKTVMAPGPRGSGDYRDILYLEVLGKKFDVTLSTEYIMDKLVTMRDNYGNRVKTGTIDWKALSHSVRIVTEVEELLLTNKIQFPLKNASYLKEIKSGSRDLEETLNYVAERIDYVDTLIAESELPSKPDYQSIEEVLLNLLGANTSNT